MFHYVPQLIAKFSCLLFDAKQVVYRGVFTAFSFTETNQNRADGGNQSKPKQQSQEL